MKKLPVITDATVQSLVHDIEGDDPDLNPSSLLRRMQKDNPKLAEVAAIFARNNTQCLGNMLYLCELVRRQAESDQMEEDLK